MIRNPSPPFLALLLSGAAIGWPAPASQAIEVARWQVYGTTPLLARNPTLPGGGDVQAPPRDAPGEPWSSGAVMTLPRPLKAGERVTALLWARSARPESVNVTLQGGPPEYEAVAAGRVRLTPRWEQHAISGVARADLPAGSQSLFVPLGRARSAVSLGPVAFLSGSAAPPAQAFAGFQPVQVAEDVRIPSDPGVVLAGTLRLPARNGKAPYPVVVVLAGSGPNPRGGFPPLVDRLTEAGIATLDYDKRGIGQSSGSFLDTMEAMERDAAAALRYLRSRPEIDGRRIALLGLSQGGVVGPAVAAEDQGIAALVMLSGPAGEQHKLFLDGMGSALVSGGTRHEAIEAILAAAARYMDAQAEAAPAETIRPLEAALREAFAAGGHPPDKVAQFIATLSHPAVVSQYRVAPNAALRRIKGPVLALYASEDGMTEQSLPQARIALRGNPDAIVAEMPAVNHTFQRQESDAGGKPVFAGAAVSDAATLDVILPWLEKRLEAKRP